jgi:L-lysine 2,3-aminomutase
VKGAAHFEVTLERGRELMEELRKRLPGYAVPRYVREVAGELFKVPLEKSGERKAVPSKVEGRSAESLAQEPQLNLPP